MSASTIHALCPKVMILDCAIEVPTPYPEPAIAADAPGAVGICVRGLTKRYGQRLALDALSFDVKAGEMVALLGPNGAGKSTLFQILTGLFVADAGSVEVAGYSLAREPTRALRDIGVVFQAPSLDLDLSVERNWRFHADLHGLHRGQAEARAKHLAERLGLTEAITRRVRELSGGNRRKVELVRALLHKPRVLLMDEPTVGLDIQSRRELLQAVADEVRQSRVAVLWATHLTDEALIADRVFVMHQGRRLAEGTPAAVALMLAGRSQGDDAPSLEDAFVQATQRAQPTSAKVSSQ